MHTAGVEACCNRDLLTSLPTGELSFHELGWSTAFFRDAMDRYHAALRQGHTVYHVNPSWNWMFRKWIASSMRFFMGDSSVTCRMRT
jgi:hypothetical protein